MARGRGGRAPDLVPRAGGRGRAGRRTARPHAEPGGRLPTTWGSLTDAPVTQVTPTDGELPYTEDVFIGYRAWEKEGRHPDLPLRPRPRLHRLDLRRDRGHAARRSRSASPTPAHARGRETVQIYVAPTEPDTTRPPRWLAGFATRRGTPGRDSRGRRIELPSRAFETWDEKTNAWTPREGLVRDRGVPLAHRPQAEGNRSPPEARDRGCPTSAAPAALTPEAYARSQPRTPSPQAGPARSCWDGTSPT